MQTENKAIYVHKHDINRKVGEVVPSEYGAECAYIGDGNVIFAAHANHIYKADFRNVDEKTKIVTAVTTFTLDTPDEVEWFNKLQTYVRENGTPYHETILISEKDDRFSECGHVVLDDDMGWSLGVDLDAEVKQLYENLHAIENMRVAGAVDAKAASNGKVLNFSADVDDISARLEYLRERLERGFDDTETWSLYSTIGAFVVPRLVRFKEINIGYPPSLTYEEWVEILDKMIYSFSHCDYEEIDYDGVEWYDLPKERMEAELARIGEGLRLFSEYFFALWW